MVGQIEQSAEHAFQWLNIPNILHTVLYNAQNILDFRTIFDIRCQKYSEGGQGRAT